MQQLLIEQIILFKHYQGTPQVKDAFKLMVKANQKLGLTEAANRAQAVLTAISRENLMSWLKKLLPSLSSYGEKKKGRA